MRRQARLLGNKASDDTSTVEGEEESESEEVVGLTPEEMAEVEREMWLRFHGAGFWRSPSQIERNQNQC